MSEKHQQWNVFSKEQKRGWFDLDTLPERVKRRIDNFGNMPENIRDDLEKSDFEYFGWHIGSISGTEGEGYVLVPSQDKGYGYGVFSNPETIALRFAGGKRYQRKPGLLPILPVPYDKDCTFKISPRGDFVACSTGRAVLIEKVKTMIMSAEEVSKIVTTTTEEAQQFVDQYQELVERYQRNAKDFQLIWGKSYQLVNLEKDESGTIRNQGLGNSSDPLENMRVAVEYVKTKIV